MSNLRFMLNPDFLNTLLDNNFGVPSFDFPNTDVYVGLGIDFDEESFSFTKEPVSKGFTILDKPVKFGDPLNGIIRNIDALEWPKAKEDWTTGNDIIKYLGLYYRYEKSEYDTEYKYKLIAVLPLQPAETVKYGEKMSLNTNMIQLRLANR